MISPSDLTSSAACSSRQSIRPNRNGRGIAKRRSVCPQRLIRRQSTTWSRAPTGFVTTAYALHALARLYPETAQSPQRSDFVPRKGESLLAAVRRVRTLALTGDARFADLMVDASKHPSPIVRYWALIGLGAC